jgi:hypothetical protein
MQGDVRMSMLTSIRFIAAGTLMLGAARALDAQAFAATSSGNYPNVNQVIAIAPGDTVHLLNQFIFDRGPALRVKGKRLDVQYSTRIPAANGDARQQQADRAAEFFGAQASNMGVRRMGIGICDTRECAENRKPPSAWYQYERTVDGKWQRVR